jgi:microcystin-dependent protein
MAQPYIGEIRLFAGNFEPDGWKFCNGQHLAIATNDTLFQLIGTTYGGDGSTDFALPDLRGRVPVHQGVASSGTTFQIGEMAGTEDVTLTVQQIPAHTHALLGTSDAATTNAPTNNVFATSTGATVFPYGTDQPLTTLHPSTMPPAGGSQPHTNLQPFLCINYIISRFGIFPSPT